MNEFKSLGLGPFEFPISGSFSVVQENGASVLTSADESTKLNLSFFQFRRSTQDRESLLRSNEALLKRNWESFAKEERGRVVKPFAKLFTNEEFTIFSMATEFKTGSDLQHYVQYAITDGPNLGHVIVEGFGKAEPITKQYDTIFEKTTIVKR